MTEVRYQENGNNRLLRHVLCVLWEHQCHWCRQFKGYLDLQIDHVLPKTSGEAGRVRLKQGFKLPDDFDVHAPYNLAPICGACNGTKADADLTEYGVVLMTLKKARKLAPAVASRVDAFGKPSKLAGALLEMAEADLGDATARETFEQGAPAVIQRLAELGEGKADFSVFRTVEVESGDELHRVGLRLNEPGRAAVAALERVAGGQLEKALSAPLSDLFDRVASAAGGAFESHDEGMGAPDVGSVEVDWPEITIDRIEFESSPPAQLEFEFAGEFEVMVSASIARDSPADGDLEYVQGDGVASGRFEFHLSWEPSDPVGQYYFDQVWLEDWQADVWVDGGRCLRWEDFFGAGQTEGD